MEYKDRPWVVVNHTIGVCPCIYCGDVKDQRLAEALYEKEKQSIYLPEGTIVEYEDEYRGGIFRAVIGSSQAKPFAIEKFYLRDSATHKLIRYQLPPWDFD